MATRRIVLVRHAKPDIEAGVPSADWKLSADGQDAAAALAQRLRDFHLAGIASSPEAKAVGTAEAIAARLGLPVEIDDGFAEQARRSVGYLSREDLEAGIASLFNNPDQLVFGDETANDCFTRFQRALDRQAAKSEGDIVAVTHGTILSIYVGRMRGVNPMLIWRGLGLPTAVVLSEGELRVIDP